MSELIERLDVAASMLNRPCDFDAVQDAKARIAALVVENERKERALSEARKWIAPLCKQGEDRIWRAADHAVAIIDAALGESA